MKEIHLTAVELLTQEVGAAINLIAARADTEDFSIIFRFDREVRQVTWDLVEKGAVTATGPGFLPALSSPKLKSEALVCALVPYKEGAAPDFLLEGRETSLFQGLGWSRLGGVLGVQEDVVDMLQGVGLEAALAAVEEGAPEQIAHWGEMLKHAEELTWAKS